MAMSVLRRGEDGQATVGFAVALPAALAVALISFNVSVFLSECARFDRLARNAVRVCAASPSYGQSAGECALAIGAMVEDEMDSEGLSCSVFVEESSGLERYEVLFEYEPTLFGMPLNGSAFGLDLFKLKHAVSLSVDSYDPSVLL